MLVLVLHALFLPTWGRGEALESGEDICHLFSTYLFRNHLFILIQEHEFRGSEDVESGAEIQALQGSDACVNELRSAVLGVDQRVVADMDPVFQPLFTHILLPRFGLEVVADCENL